MELGNSVKVLVMDSVRDSIDVSAEDSVIDSVSYSLLISLWTLIWDSTWFPLNGSITNSIRVAVICKAHGTR